MAHPAPGQNPSPQTVHENGAAFGAREASPDRDSGGTMRRREFLILLGIATVTSPHAAHAQQPALPAIGFLNGGSVVQFGHLAAAFRDGLSQAGFIEGQNVIIEYRWRTVATKRCRRSQPNWSTCR